MSSRLSECLLWKLQEDYYASLGVGAWDNAVPFHCTNSAYMAEACAEAILACLEDYFEHLHPEEPVYILELAAGAGRLSFLVLTELQTRLAYFPHLERLKLRYVMTDFTENNLRFWQDHPNFAPFIERGQLDFAIFAPENENCLDLRVSGEKLAAGRPANPVIVLANYFFDTIRHDVFQIINGTLHEGLVRLDYPEGSEPKIEQIKLSYAYQECSPDYYGDTRLDAILKYYLGLIPHGPIILPIGGLRAIQNLYDLSGQNLILISSDKAYTTPSRMLLERNYGFAAHGSFSFMVNYHAIGHWFLQAGGSYAHTTTLSDDLETVACTAVRQSCSFHRLRYLFEQRFHLAHSMVTVTRVVGDLCETTVDDSPPQLIPRLLALMRLSLGDPRDFCLIAAKLAPLLSQSTVPQQCDLLEIMQLVWKKFYFFRGERNLPYWFAEVYYQLGRYEDSLKCLDIAFRCYDEFADEYFCMKGRSFEKLNRWLEARQMYAQALRLNPSSQSAQAGLSSLLIRERLLQPADTR